MNYIGGALLVIVISFIYEVELEAYCRAIDIDWIRQNTRCTTKISKVKMDLPVSAISKTALSISKKSKFANCD